MTKRARKESEGRGEKTREIKTRIKGGSSPAARDPPRLRTTGGHLLGEQGRGEELRSRGERRRRRAVVASKAAHVGNDGGHQVLSPRAAACPTPSPSGIGTPTPSSGVQRNAKTQHARSPSCRERKCERQSNGDKHKKERKRVRVGKSRRVLMGRTNVEMANKMGLSMRGSLRGQRCAASPPSTPVSGFGTSGPRNQFDLEWRHFPVAPRRCAITRAVSTCSNLRPGHRRGLCRKKARSGVLLVPPPQVAQKAKSWGGHDEVAPSPSFGPTPANIAQTWR